MKRTERSKVALLDLDDSLADYSTAMHEQMSRIASPGEPPLADSRMTGVEAPWLEARRKLIQRQPGFWRGLRRIPEGFVVVDTLRQVGFSLHVLTKGPKSSPNAWGEKLEWCQAEIPDAVVTLAGDKSLVCGRVLYDDYPPYFEAWLEQRPRGLVVCLAQPWNASYAPGGKDERPNVFRFDSVNVHELRSRLQNAFSRVSP